MQNVTSNHRPVGLKASAVLLVVFALLWIVTTIPLITIIVSFAYGRTRNLYAVTITQCAAEVCVAGLSILMGYAALGLAQDKNSGRWAAMLVGALIAFTGILLALTMAASELVHSSYLLSSPVHLGIGFAAIFFAVIAAFGIYLLIYLNSSATKNWFYGDTYYIPSAVKNSSQPATDTKADAVTYGYLPVSTHAPAIDASSRIARSLVKVFSILLLVGAVVVIIYASSGLPVTCFGINLQAAGAVIFHIAFASLAIATAIGLLRRIPLFYGVALVLECVSTANRLLMLVPSYRLRASAFYAAHYPAWHHLSPWSQILRNAISSTAFILYLSLGAFFLWALWSDLNSIRQSRQRAALDSQPIPELGLPL
jgi:hypothetical protein